MARALSLYLSLIIAWLNMALSQKVAPNRGISLIALNTTLFLENIAFDAALS